MRKWVGIATFGLLFACGACGAAGSDARYPPREAGCPVKTFPGEPTTPVSDLGVVDVDCVPGRGERSACERQALDVICTRGGDVAWGLADNALTSGKLVVHAAHTRRSAEGNRVRGCAVRVFTDAPPVDVENIGPVTALCATDDTKEVCLRELQDQACLIGGDVLWQVDGPSPAATSAGDKLRMHGRAAHTK
jgi:hypothetical protein